MTISPTFALQAHTLLQRGNVEEAIALCERGLEVYPDYATAYSILAQAYERIENSGRAEAVLERGIRRLPLERSLLRMKTVKGNSQTDILPLPSASSANDRQSENRPAVPAFTIPTPVQDNTPAENTLPEEEAATGEMLLPATEGDIEPEVVEFADRIEPDILERATEQAGATELEQPGIQASEIQTYRQDEVLEQVEFDNPRMQEPEEQPEIELPEPQKPEIQEPEQQPGIELPESDKPEVQEPEKNPEIELPEPQKPEIQEPEQQPGIELPEPDKPEVQEPEKNPEIELPEPQKPEIQEPEQQPGIELPEPDKPEVQEPEKNPEIELPEPQEPEIGKAGLVQSDEPILVDSTTKPIAGNGTLHSLSLRSNSSDAPTASAPAPRHSHLRIIESADTTEMPSLIWRSRNVRLIPGLEFTPLRFESKKDKLYRPSYRIPDPPPFPEFEVTKKKPIRFQQQLDDSRTPLTPLEELARRLEAARIPRVEEEESHPLPPPTVPRSEQSSPMVTETMAKIYEMQGAMNEAVKAYEALARQKPDMAEQYTKKARELKNKM